IATVLDAMHPEGYWVRPGHGYTAKYRSTVWAMILLAQLGASIVEDDRIRTACNYLFEHNMSANGQFSTSDAPSGTVDCLQGNLCAALLDLGCDDPRLEKAIDWMARSTTGEGVAPSSEKQAVLRYYAYKSGPVFECGVNNARACAWGGVKVMLAFSKLPAQRRTPLVNQAIRLGVDFLFSVDPADATYPTRIESKPNRSWWKFGFPVFYVTDLLQNVEALARLGYGQDPRLARAVQFIEGQQDPDGRWRLEYDYAGKTWLDFGPKHVPNKWVTLRAARVLKNIWG
ncbi:MAG: nitrogen fixation protein NifH, partial [Anaerolineae bacterium]|nr:nitrogen fixation protein NifH [Anaerolineae bacterium]